MEYTVREIIEPSEIEMQGIIRLWNSSFGDSEEFIRSFYEKMPIHSTICIIAEDIPVSMSVLISVGSGYYGYAVCTFEEYRGRGLCRRIHEYIKEKCKRENREYFIHPADSSLEVFYKKLGMTPVLSSYEVRCISYNGEKVRQIPAPEYMRIRDLFFGGYRYYPWSESALSFMSENGIEFYYADIDGFECGAAVDGGRVIELCAPDHLMGKAASAFIPDTEITGYVRFLTEHNHMDETALMSFSGEYAYFNLFFE